MGRHDWFWFLTSNWITKGPEIVKSSIAKKQLSNVNYHALKTDLTKISSNEPFSSSSKQHFCALAGRHSSMSVKRIW